MKKHALLIVWIIVITFVAGIAGWSIAAYMGGSRAQNKAYKPSPSQAVAILTKDGTPLSYKYWIMPNDLQNYVQSLISNYKTYYGKEPDSLFELPKMQVDAIKQLADQKVVNYFANTNNISVENSEVNSQLAALVKQYTSNPQTKSYIINKYGSIKNFENAIKPNVRQNLITQKVINLVANVTENDVKKYYEEHKKEIENQYDEVKASHILVSSEATADKILKMIKDKKITFYNAAKKYSKDTGSATNGGELGWFTRTQMVKPFAEAAFNAKVGEIVGPVQSQYGWHLIDVEGKKLYNNFNAVKSATPIYNTLLNEVKNQKFYAWLKKYKKDEHISYKIEGDVLPYVEKFYSIPATDTARIKRFIDEMSAYVYPTKNATVNLSIDPRLLALYETALETYKSDLQSQNTDLESYYVNSPSTSSTYVNLSSNELESKLREVSKEMDKATGTAFSKLFNEKLDLQRALNFVMAKEKLEKEGYKTQEQIQQAYQKYQANLKDISNKIKEVLEALYKVAPYSADVVTKLYKVDPSNKKVALQYFQNQYKLLEPMISNKETFKMYSSQLTPYLAYVKSGLESIEYTSNSTTIKQGALVTLISMSEKMKNYTDELKYLKQLKKVNPKYPGINDVIKQIEGLISKSSTPTSTGTSLQSTPALNIPLPTNK
ncbi:peptidylprolyl isomerase [Mesoaciditoga sp.]